MEDKPISRNFKKKPTKGTKNTKAQASTPRDKEKEKPSAAAIMKQIEEMHLDLEAKTEELRQLGQKVGINTDLYFKYITSISQDTTKAYAKARKKLTDYVEENAPKKALPKAKSVDKLSQERRGKMRGPRNRWIPVQ